MSIPPLDPFGQPLQPDPSVALQTLDVVIPSKTGPLHKVQFVIEYVGPRTIPAPAAVHLLGADWYQALGHPALFAMRPADLHWQPLTNSTDGSYDSLAVCWDLITSRGQMSSKSARHLFQTAERFGPFIQRRAMPIPPPDDVSAIVKTLADIRDGLDIGFSVNVYGPAQGFAERELWIVCARLGLAFASPGSFDWKLAGHAEPLFSVTPFGSTDAFSLANVQRGLHHPGVTIGFRLPLCPAPTQALAGAFHAAAIIARELHGQAIDEDDRPLSASVQAEYQANLREALTLFSHAGMTAGSPEAIRLFS